MTLPSLYTLDDNAVRVLCAEVRGWTPVKPWEKCLEELRYSHPSHLPNFPVDHNAAITLADTLAKEGWLAVINQHRKYWKCEFHGPGCTTLGATIVQSTGPTLARAIANAFLLVRNLATP